ncbi:phosphatidylserine decarboxylase [Amorphus orientalis]|uniref:Phosphatidylserine decarboxylase n=1 Tax=Amorphus orientalis TaxID=649198 RepID=A0AAE3VLS2_9HYPH|nr:phosphatidylserine decarboxylase [Amorphus orientalis]MDQ0314080.1 phosphatidylserine decarboxylase [Amorphus orientalis]
MGWCVRAAGVVSILAASTGLALANDSPCQSSLDYLSQQYDSDAATRAAFDAVYEGLQPLPPGYAYGGSTDNPWTSAGSGEGLAKAVGAFYREVCTLVPQIVGTNDNALDSIQYFAWLYFRNEAGIRMVKGIDPTDPDRPLDTLKTFLIRFGDDYKAFMNSPASTGPVADWVADPRLEIEDYEFQKADQYKSWNAFFARALKGSSSEGYPARPVTMPDRDYVIVSPTDCIMNPLVQAVKLDPGPVTRKLVDNPLQLDTVLDVKGIPISVTDLLADAPEDLKAKFAGATGLSCVLMPNTYHHFHSPVDGVIRYAEIVEAGSPGAYGTYGYSDWPNWVPLSGNVGRPGTDFSQFQGFQRGVVVIEVEYANLPGKTPETLTGYVASIPVGLDTVGSVVFDATVTEGARVTKGVTRFGNFLFGGSLNILLFSPIEGTDGAPMVSPAVQTRMGNQIAIMNTPYPAPKTPWTPDD